MVIEPARTKNSPYHCFGEFQYRYIHVKERMIDGNREPVLHERDLKNRMGWDGICNGVESLNEEIFRISM